MTETMLTGKDLHPLIDLLFRKRVGIIILFLIATFGTYGTLKILKVANFQAASMVMVKIPLVDLDFRLDPNYPHSLKDTRGYRYLENLDEKRTLLTHAVTRVDVGIPVPGFIRKALSSRDLPGVVRNLKKRIESGGTWTKSDKREKRGR